MWRMEDLLDLYAEPYHPLRPLVCFDELPYQLLAHVQPPLPVQPGQPQRIDYEYERRGTCNILGCFQPLGGWRHFQVTSRRTATEFAYCMQALVDIHFPEAEVIRVVLDNLNTHTPAALYATFPAAEARRLTQKLEFHYTPKHGSWLNMIEIEFSVLARQCLKQRVPDQTTVQTIVDQWVEWRNAHRTTVDWRFTTLDARTRLRDLYPLQL